MRGSEYQQAAFSRGIGAQPPTLGLGRSPGGASSPTYAIASTHTKTLNINQQSMLVSEHASLLGRRFTGPPTLGCIRFMGKHTPRLL